MTTIAVTGLGAVTALGRTATATWDAVRAGERALRELTLFDPGDVKCRLVAEVSGLVAPAGQSRTSELALLAAREALEDAGLDVCARRVGLVVGGTTAGMFETESILATLLEAPAGSAEREGALARMLTHPLSAPTDRLVAELGPFARARSLSSACSSGANAILVGATWLELGLVDAVLAGAADALCRVIVAGFNALGALDPAGARPFDVARRGLTLGEGAGFVVLERAEETQRAKCTLLGWAARSEAHHITNPEASGAVPAAVMRAALARAGVAPADVDYVNAHGTGTPLNDPMETRALAAVFGADLARVPVSSQKGMLGHTLAAAGAIEAVLTAKALVDGVVPPTGGLVEPDPACALRHVRAAEERSVRVALSSSFGFGGMDTALVLGAAARRAPAPPPPRGVVVTGVAAISPVGMFRGPDVATLPSHTSQERTVSLPADALDAERARRLDRTSRLGAVLADAALAPPGAGVASPPTEPRAVAASVEPRTAEPPGAVAALASVGPRTAEPREQRRAGEGDAREAALVLGVAFGAVDGTADFMRRLRDKGARLVRPADFPSLVPSSPAGYGSIYLGLGGPALVVADLAASGECALAQAWELVASGEVARVCAAAVEERSAIVEGALSAIFGGAGGEARGEGGAAIALAAEGTSEPVLARLDGVWSWNGDAAPPLPAADVVVSASDVTPIPAPWSSVRRVSCASAGAHEAVGAIAVAVAVAMVARGDVQRAAFTGTARGCSYAGTVSAP
ncbi:MAG: beta-ketoacyl-[acyl-carrier-protein] synthase family protein [Labilithrix sp.]|nr:beta-ketoacyl-[acyl-carrier-protein] synthase family protein [Labilithrix sp.]MCW5816334.1 beta-ketoacyl-[acyl-carrier-protein] synthase family protein [Labilithrix sp.]